MYKSLPIRSLLALIALTLAGCAPRAATLPPVAAPSVSHRVVETRTGEATSFERLVGRALEADVVFFGEFHDDPGTHRLQLALLEAAAQRRPGVVLALEMFERDVQPALDAYLTGEINEEEFLARSRPWSNYNTDYRPLIEFAKERGIPVLAANVPRRIAARVSRGGLDTLSTLPDHERPYLASEIICPRDSYHERFAAEMQGHPGMTEAVVMRFYQAQCVKDETMAESITEWLSSHPDALVIHMNGYFHSDYGAGIPERVLRRRPGTKTLILTGIPVADPVRETPVDDPARAEYLLFTRRPAGKE